MNITHKNKITLWTRIIINTPHMNRSMMRHKKIIIARKNHFLCMTICFSFHTTKKYGLEIYNLKIETIHTYSLTIEYLCIYLYIFHEKKKHNIPNDTNTHKINTPSKYTPFCKRRTYTTKLEIKKIADIKPRIKGKHKERTTIATDADETRNGKPFFIFPSLTAYYSGKPFCTTTMINIENG